MTAEAIIRVVNNWAKQQPSMQAVVLVGSHARGTARAESDIDLVMITATPEIFRTDQKWIKAIDWKSIGAHPQRWDDESYGALWVRRVWLDMSGEEIEIGFALPSWAEVNPVDPGTERVISDGLRVLYDPNGLIDRLCDALTQSARA